MRIVFMGTPDFAVPTLRRLLEGPDEVAGVFTQPDRAAGRGYKLIPPPVKVLAEEHRIPVFQPNKLKEEGVAEQLAGLAPDVIVVVAYGNLLPPSVLELPPCGCINVHGSLLPRYRGAAPIQRCVLNGDAVTGVTTMYMAKGLDTGDILLQRETPVGENETAGELFDRLSEMGADLLMETLRRLKEGTLHPVKQDDGASSYAHMLSRDMAALDWSRPARQIHNQIRGLSPWPCAETRLRNSRLKIYRSEIVSDKQGEPGKLLSEKDFIVACGEQAVRLLEVQYEGSRRMSGGDFLRGRRLKLGETLG